ncbi:hypothetical protein ACU8KH_05873 [Lachancea thermotolerans]
MHHYKSSLAKDKGCNRVVRPSIFLTFSTGNRVIVAYKVRVNTDTIQIRGFNELVLRLQAQRE